MDFMSIEGVLDGEGPRRWSSSGALVRSMRPNDLPAMELDETKRKHRRALVEAITENPDILLQADDQGNLQLHAQLHQSTVDEELVQLMLRVKPELVEKLGRFKRTPLHCALIRTQLYPDTIRILLDAFPEACSYRTKGGWLPIHYAADHDEPCVPALRMLHEVHPAGVQTLDQESKTPLHWAIDRDTINLDAVLFLFRLHKRAALHIARVEVRHQFVPHLVQGVNYWCVLEKLRERAESHNLDLSSNAHHIALRIMLYELRSDIDSRMRTLRIETNWRIRRNLIMCVAVFSASKSGSSSPSKGNYSSTSPTSVLCTMHGADFEQGARSVGLRDTVTRLYKHDDLWPLFLSFL